jgi:HK97 family phage prohead protease
LGRTSAGTLKVHADEKGLFYDCELPATEAANSLWISVQRKDITGSSFAFFPVKENWIPAAKPGDLPTRQIIDAEIDGGDVSPCAYPAYAEGTSVNARSLAATRDAAASSHLGAVPFSLCSAKSERAYNVADEANSLFSWSDGEDEDRSADAPVKNKLKAAQGFLYVKNAGEKRSDYVGPHHTIVDGQLAHSQIGALRCLSALVQGKLEIPAEHRAAAKQHLDGELSLWIGDEGESEDGGDAEDSEIERSKARARLAEAKATL